MPCAFPRSQWFVDGSWTQREPLSPSLYRRQQFGCGSCAPCRLGIQGEWTVRLVHESMMHPHSICLTATLAPEFVDPIGSLHPEHVEGFIRRLRKLVAKRGAPSPSFDAYGEYSPPPLMRPHYHVALFNYFPPDAKSWAKSPSGNPEFTSAELSKAWQEKGLLTFQPFDHGAAQYCAGHQAWKLTGDKGRALRQVVDSEGRVIAERAPEFHRCSNRPGIGRRFVEAYGAQTLASGHTVLRGKPAPIPSYYLRRGDVTFPEITAKARAARTAHALASQAELTDHNLYAGEVIAEQRISQGERKLR